MSHSIIPLTAAEKELVEFNMEYARGLYELYPSDDDVQNAMRQKGLSEAVIYEIKRKIKHSALEIRLQQAKRHMIYGTALLVVCYIIKYFLSQLPGADSLMSGEGAEEGILRFVFRFYAEIFYFLMFLSLLRALAGFLSFRHYRKLLSEKL